MLLDGIDNNINEYTDSGKAGYGGKLFSFWQRVNNSDHLSRSWYWAEGYCICLDCNWMNSIQGGSGPIKKPASAGFNVIGSRDSVAYPFLSPHRLVGVLLRLITSCFCWCSPYTVQSWAGGSWTRIRKILNQLNVNDFSNLKYLTCILRAYCSTSNVLILSNILKCLGATGAVISTVLCCS